MWNLNFITRDDLKKHIAKTIESYDEALKKIDLRAFNSNLIDPIKLLFDKMVYKKSFEEIISVEIVRQRNKSITNSIGYFHQNIFRYIKNCEIPEKGFDIIFDDGIRKNYIEMKNKHNTMNSSSSQKTYMRMKSKILEDNNCVCYLVEAIAKNSQNIIWELFLDYEKVSNERIRRISIDKFYGMVTNDSQAFYKLCQVLPELIQEIISENEKLNAEPDTVIEELKLKNPDLLNALYMLAFKKYEGFK